MAIPTRGMARKEKSTAKTKVAPAMMAGAAMEKGAPARGRKGQTSQLETNTPRQT